MGFSPRYLSPIAYSAGTSRVFDTIDGENVFVSPTTDVSITVESRGPTGGAVSQRYSCPSNGTIELEFFRAGTVSITALSAGLLSVVFAPKRQVKDQTFSSRLVRSDGTLIANGEWTAFPAETDGLLPPPNRNRVQISAGRVGSVVPPGDYRVVDSVSGAVLEAGALLGTAFVTVAHHPFARIDVRQALGADGAANNSVFIGSWMEI